MDLTFGRYRLTERIGQGSMAEVWKAKSFGVEGFEKTLVIKRVLPHLAVRPEFARLFVEEAKLAVRLSHANIVQVFDLGLAVFGDEHDASYFMAMEYVHGLDLASVLAALRRRGESIPLDVAVFVASEVAKGLDHAHRRKNEALRPLGIVHRDVSPANVLLSFEGEVKVADFGIAKARGALDRDVEDTGARRLHGKFGYMSPEQAGGQDADARSDLFSLGAVLYECVTGVPPFSGPTTFETLRRVQAAEYTPADRLRGDIPAALSELLRTAMGRSAGERFPTAGKMYEALLGLVYSSEGRGGSRELAGLLERVAAPTASPAPRMSVLAEDSPKRSTTALPLATGEAPRTVVSPPLGECREVSVLVLRAGSSGEPGRATYGEAAGRLEGERGTPFEQYASILRGYGARLQGTGEGGLVAIFGLGDPDGSDTELAVRAARVILRAAPDGAEIGIGVDSVRLQVLNGALRAEDRHLEESIAAARALAAHATRRCFVTPLAAAAIWASFAVEELTPAEASRLPSPGRVVNFGRNLPASAAPFVGRREELRIVGAALASAIRRQPQVLTVRGDQGTGKTRLLAEAERRLDTAGHHVGWYTAACPPGGAAIPLSGIVSMLRTLCGVSEGDTPRECFAVSPRLRALGLGEDDVAAVLTALGAAAPPSSGVGSAVLRHAFVRMVASLCEDRAHVFAWDSAQALDEESMAILEVLLERLPTARLLLVIATRASFSHVLERKPGVTIELGDLPHEDALFLVKARLGAAAIPAELVTFLRERAGGNPQFLLELLSALSGSVTVADSTVVSMRLGDARLTFPKSLRGLVAMRLARLLPRDRATLSAAAVLGDPVSVAVLATMLGQSTRQLNGSLAALALRELLVHAGPSVVRFASPLYPEIILDSLTAEAAVELHLAAAEALARTREESRAGVLDARIGAHLHAAGDHARAARHYAAGASERLRSRELEAAAKDYVRAMALCDLSSTEPSELAGWIRALARVAAVLRAIPGGPGACERVLMRVDSSGGAELRVRAWLDYGALLGAIHAFNEAEAALERAEVIADAAPPLARAVLMAYAVLAVRRGDFHQALAMIERREGVEGIDQERGELLLTKAHAHAALGNRKHALLALAEAEEKAAPDDYVAACERAKMRALALYYARDFEGAVLASERAVDMARDLGLHYQVAVNLHNLGDSFLRAEDPSRAYGALRQSMEACELHGFERLANHDRMYLAYLDGLAGHVDAAEKLEEAIGVAADWGYAADEVEGRVLLGRLHAARGDAEAARAELTLAHQLGRDSGNRLATEDAASLLASVAAPASP